VSLQRPSRVAVSQRVRVSPGSRRRRRRRRRRCVAIRPYSMLGPGRSAVLGRGHSRRCSSTALPSSARWGSRTAVAGCLKSPSAAQASHVFLAVGPRLVARLPRPSGPALDVIAVSRGL
jgi:hypothetical protein